MKCKRVLAMLLAAGMILTSSVTNVNTVWAEETQQSVTAENVQTADGVVKEAEITADDTVQSENDIVTDGLTITEADKESVSADIYANNTDKLMSPLDVVPDAEDMVRVIIVMDGDSVVEKNADAQLNLWTRIQSWRLEGKQDKVVSKIENRVFEGDTLEIKYNYTWLVNGVATEVPYGMISEIKEIDGVEDVILQPVYELAEEGIETYTIADGEMIGREDTWANGYTGKGIKIAIIDTGLDDDHQNFQAMSEDKLTKDSATKTDVEKVLSDLNASDLYPNLTVDQVYRSNKVVFGFNYVDQSTVINHSKDSQGDHGTHVAGIAAANDLNNGEAVGVAPDAQLFVMKIFGANGGAYSEDILASLEDALKLGADVVNMSLGSPAGFTSESDKMDEIYGRVSETNTILAVAAGNSSTAGAGNMWGTDTNLTSNPDNSIISSPAVYQNVTSVASVENVKVQSNYIEIGGTVFGYQDGSDGANEVLSTLAGKTFEYAMVGNYGQEAEDFTNADVEGKIAVVQRGVTNFSKKHELAQQAGAVACLIYNNTGGILSMGLTDGTGTIPCASITLAAGEYLAAEKQENAAAVITIGNGQTLIPNEAGGQMSDFSSWGVSPNLMLEPDISAPGGNIYSTLDGGTYGLMSGTSMATPNVAGISALVMQYAKEVYPKMADDELHDFVNALLLSSSEPIVYDTESGLTYSPRQQGSGLANAYSATKTKAYLSVDDDDMPKAQLYDDPQKTGAYSFTYHVNNFGDSTIYYALSTNAQTEAVETYDEYKFMATTPYALSAATAESSKNMVYTYDYDGNGSMDSHDARDLYFAVVKGEKALESGAEFRYELDGEEGITEADVQAYLDALVGKNTKADLDSQVLKVEAGKTADVAVSVALSGSDRAYIEENFENGIYVEGFTYLTAKSSGDVDLSMPYLAFYGDWTKAPLIDDGYYWDEETNASQYWNILWSSIQGSSWLPGLNPYLEDEAFDTANIAVSPNEDGITDKIEDIYISLLRNADTVEISYENAESGEVYYDEVYDKIQKTYYVSSAGSMLPFIWAGYTDQFYDFTDADGNVLENNTVVLLKAKTALDYDKHEAANAHDTWEVTVTIDTEAPVVKRAEVVKEDGKQYLDLTFWDNQKVAAVCFLNKAGAVTKAKYAVDSKAGEEVTERYDITGYGNEFMIVLGDYAVNETYYTIETEDNIPEVDETKLYAYRVHTDTIYDDTLYGWVTVDAAKKNEDKDIVVTEQNSEYYMDYSLQAAEYVDGYVLAVDAGGQLVRLTPGVWDDRVVIAEYGVEVKELTYDPVDQVLYGYTGGTKDNYTIVKIDISTGEMTEIATKYTWWTNTRPYAMACDMDGNLYAIDGQGLLKTIDKTTGAWNDEILLDTGLTPMNVQSMAYNQKENSLYWAAYLKDETSYLYKIDLSNDYELTLLGHLDDNPELDALIYLNEKNFDIPEENVQEIAFEKESVTVLSGTSTDLTVSCEPWYGETGGLTWTSSDESIASVDLKGTVTGKKEGTVTITAVSAAGPKAECLVHVVKPKSDIYGFVIGANSGIANQWLHVNTGYLKGAETVSELSWVTYAAAEYYDGYIYAYNDTTEFYRIDPTDYKATKLTNANSDWRMRDMAYDYSTGFMYGIADSMEDGYVYLVCIDITTGLIEKATVNSIFDEKEGMPITIAVSTEGTIYMVTDTGYLCEYEVGELETGDDFGWDDGDYGIGGDDFGWDDGDYGIGGDDFGWDDGDYGIGGDDDFGVGDDDFGVGDDDFGVGDDDFGVGDDDDFGIGGDDDFGIGGDDDFGIGGDDDFGIGDDDNFGIGEDDDLDWDDDNFGIDSDEEEEMPLPMGTLTTIGVTGVSHMAGLTSMVYDHNTGDMYYSYSNGYDAEQLALLDQENGTALTVGSIAGGAQIVGFYTVPDEIPEREEVPVTAVKATKSELNMVKGMELIAPVKVLPFNATDKTITWKKFDEEIISIENNVITAKKAGQTDVVAEIGDNSAQFTVNVYESAGEMRGFVVYDFMYEEQNSWSAFKDSDLTTGDGLADADGYAIDAAEYYNGKVYAYDNMNAQFIVLNAEMDKYEVLSRIDVTNPDIADMAFDYSEGVMYALSCIRNVNDANTTLYAVNIEDGSVYKIGEQNVTLKAIACSTDGTLYGVDRDGIFYQIDKRTGKETYLFETGYLADVYQSMTYDHNTGSLYWAQCCWNGGENAYANLILIDAQAQVCERLGQIGASGCQVTGLYIKPETKPEEGTAELESISLSGTNEMLSPGDTMKLSAVAQPFSISLYDIVFDYRSTDENVVTVDAQGNVTAVAAGMAEIIVSYADKQAVCKIAVFDNDTEFYLLNPNGFETSPLLKPSVINRRENLSDHNTKFRIAKGALHTDGYFYAVGEDGYLWKFTADMQQIEKIGETEILKPLYDTEDFRYDPEPTLTVKAMTSNVFNDKLYILVNMLDIEANMRNYLYEVDTENGTASKVMMIPWDISRAIAFAFDTEDSAIVYEGNNDYIYRVSLTDESAEMLVWAQGTVVAIDTDDIAMYYSRSLDRVFMTTTNESLYVTTRTMDLYVLNLDNNFFTKLGQAAYNQEVKGMALLEGIELAVGVTPAEQVIKPEMVEKPEMTDGAIAPKDDEKEVVEETETTDEGIVPKDDEKEVVEETETTDEGIVPKDEEEEVVEETETTDEGIVSEDDEEEVVEETEKMIPDSDKQE